MSDFDAAIALEPSNADFYHNRGFSRRKQGRYADAVADYSAAIALAPRHCRASINMRPSLQRQAVLNMA